MTVDFAALEKLFRERRSIRKWKKDPVPEDLVVQAIQAAFWSPNSGGKQPYHCYMVTSPEKIAAIGAAVQEVTDYLASLCKREEDAAAVKRWQANSGFFRQAPVLLALTAGIYQSVSDKLQAENLNEQRVCDINHCRQIASSRVQTVGAFVDHLLLALHALGLGACWMAGPAQAKPAVERILNIGPNEDFVALIPIGYPDESPAAPPRKTVEEMVTFFR